MKIKGPMKYTWSRGDTDAHAQQPSNTWTANTWTVKRTLDFALMESK